MRSVFPAIVLCLIAAVASGQPNFQPGMVVTVSGDTLQGYIDHREWLFNPVNVHFKSTLTDEKVTVLKPAWVIRFDVESESFVRYIGPLSMDKNNVRRMDVVETSFVVDTIFLKVIAAGKWATLFRHRDKVKFRYFLSSVGTPPEELVFRYYPSDSGDPNRLEVDDRFKNQLASSALNAKAMDQKLGWQIKKSNYSARSLVQIVDRINGSTKANPLSRNRSAQFFAGGGVTGTQIHFRKDLGWNSRSPFILGPYISGGVDFVPNRDVGRFVFRTELTLTTAQLTLHADSLTNNGTKTIDFMASQVTGSVTASALYHFYSTPGIKLYAGGGIKLNFSNFSRHDFDVVLASSGDTKQVPTGFDDLPFWLSFNVQGGIVLDHKFEIFAAYMPQLASFGEGFDLLGQSIRNSRLGLIYHFRYKK